MRRILLLVALLAAPAAAHAQVFSAYATYSPTHVSNVETGSVANPIPTFSTPSYTEQYASFTTSGIGGGVTFGILPLGPIHIGFDLRGSTRPGTVGTDTAMAGIRVQLKLPLLRFKPYVQASGGYLATRTVNVSTNVNGQSGIIGGTFTNQYAAYEILGGVDYKFLPFFDLRLIEIGGGKGYNTGVIFNTTGSTAGNQATLLTINTGLVFHF